jgi:hypothetical protein
MKRKPGREERRDAQDRDYLIDWKDHKAWDRAKDRQSTIEFIHGAKSKGSVAALPILLDKMKEDSEEGSEAAEAVFVIIKKNPGHADVLRLVPGLVAGLLTLDAMFNSAVVLSAIAEANPQAQECRRWQNEIIRYMHAISDMEPSIEVGTTLEELVIALKAIGDDKAAAAIRILEDSGKLSAANEPDEEILDIIRKIQL